MASFTREELKRLCRDHPQVAQAMLALVESIRQESERKKKALLEQIRSLKYELQNLEEATRENLSLESSLDADFLKEACGITTLTPELREWALKQHTEEEIVAGLKEAREHGRVELGELINEIEQGLHGREQSAD